MSFGRRRCQTFDFCQSGRLDLFFRSVAVLPAVIAQPDSKAIQQKEIALVAKALNSIRDFQLSFDRASVRRPFAAVFRDPRLHLGIFHPRRCDVECASSSRTEGLGKTALAAACAADNERDHGRGERASQFCSRDALG